MILIKMMRTMIFSVEFKFGMFVSRNHLILNMALLIMLFICFFLSFHMFWYCEPPHAVRNFEISSNSTSIKPLCNDWMFNQTCFFLFSIRNHCSEESEFITTNIVNRCPDIDKQDGMAEKVCSARKAMIFAALGFILIKALALFLYCYTFLNIYCVCFNVKFKWIKYKWDLMNTLTHFALIGSIVFWLICSGVIMHLGGIEMAPITDIILIAIFQILSLHAKKYMNDLERYRIMEDL